MLGKTSQKNHVGWFWEWEMCWTVTGEGSTLVAGKALRHGEYRMSQALRSLHWRLAGQKLEQQLSFVCPKTFGVFNCNGWSISESDFCFRVFFWLLEKRFVDGGGLEYSCRKQEGHLEYVWMQNIREETHMEETRGKQRVYWDLHVLTEGGAWQA